MMTVKNEIRVVIFADPKPLELTMQLGINISYRFPTSHICCQESRDHLDRDSPHQQQDNDNDEHQT